MGNKSIVDIGCLGDNILVAYETSFQIVSIKKGDILKTIPTADTIK